MTDIIPIDYTTPLGQVRLLVPDTDVTDFLFSDVQITTLLSLFDANVKMAAAQAKDIIAADTVMLLKVIKTDDLQVDGQKVAAELREQAKSLRELVDIEDSNLMTFVYPPADRLWNEYPGNPGYSGILGYPEYPERLLWH